MYESDDIINYLFDSYGPGKEECVCCLLFPYMHSKCTCVNTCHELSPLKKLSYSQEVSQTQFLFLIPKVKGFNSQGAVAS